jgi:hypothetical protein
MYRPFYPIQRPELSGLFYLSQNLTWGEAALPGKKLLIKSKAGSSLWMNG